MSVLLEKGYGTVLKNTRSQWITRMRIKREDDSSKVGSEDSYAEMYEEAQSKALGFICQYVSDEILVKLVDCESGSAIITKLDELYHGKDSVNIYFLLQRLAKLTVANTGGTVEKYVGEFEKIILELAAHKHLVHDVEKAAFLLSGLPDSWGSFKSQMIVGSGGKVIPLETLKSAIQAELLSRRMEVIDVDDGDRVTREERDMALVANAGVVVCTLCKKVGHSKEKCFRKCHNCGKSGHLKRDCPKMDNSGENVPFATVAVPAPVGPGSLFFSGEKEEKKVQFRVKAPHEEHPL